MIKQAHGFSGPCDAVVLERPGNICRSDGQNILLNCSPVLRSECALEPLAGLKSLSVREDRGLETWL